MVKKFFASTEFSSHLISQDWTIHKITCNKTSSPQSPSIPIESPSPFSSPNSQFQFSSPDSEDRSPMGPDQMAAFFQMLRSGGLPQSPFFGDQMGSPMGFPRGFMGGVPGMGGFPSKTREQLEEEEFRK